MVCTRDLMEPWRTRLAGWASASAKERTQLQRDIAEVLVFGEDKSCWSDVMIRPPTHAEAENHHEWLRTQLGDIVSRVYVPNLMEDPGVLFVAFEGCIVGGTCVRARVPDPTAGHPER